jgi:hypothetical protein
MSIRHFERDEDHDDGGVWRQEHCRRCSDVAYELGLRRDGQEVMVTRYCWLGRAEEGAVGSRQTLGELRLVGEQ